MCTFCGRNHNATPSTKSINVYDISGKRLGSITVPYSWSVKRYQQGLWKNYPDWYSTD